MVNEITPAWLFTQSCDFVAGVTTVKQFLAPTLPEIAFVGRSNVGKSSLLNALTNRKKLANVSHTPGRTQQINFFNLANLCFLVDLPGYGFAQVSKKTHRQWSILIEHYLSNRPSLQHVFVLIDSRHPLKESDASMMAFLSAVALPFQIILTKTDKSPPNPLLLEALQSGKSLHQHPTIALTSAHEKTGLDEVRSTIAELVR